MHYKIRSLPAVAALACSSLMAAAATPAETPRLSSDHHPAPLAGASLFAGTNLMAWCIVPFDAKKRG